jgi:Uma2 family endonuclease
MTQLAPSIETDIWVTATWDEYLQAIEHLSSQFSHSYYRQGKYRIEMVPLGYDHGFDNNIIGFAVNLFTVIQGIPATGLVNTSYRKVGVKESQPDISYYIADRAELIPYGTSIVDLDRYPAPDLVIEIASTSLSDDTGAKRLLYEDLGVKEYWIVDVKKADMIAFRMLEQGSVRITESQVLSGLKIGILTAALAMSRHTNQTQVGQWLMGEFQNCQS